MEVFQCELLMNYLHDDDARCYMICYVNENLLYLADYPLCYTPSIPLYKVYLFFQKSNECMFDQVFRKIYQYLHYETYII